MITSLDQPVRCLSGLVNVRCQGLRLLQHIALDMPILVELFLAPILLALAFRQPSSRRVVPFLILDIKLQFAITLWDLIMLVSSIPSSAIQPLDISLGVVSSLPTVLLLLFATSLFLCEVQPCLPPTLRSNIAMQGFAVVVAPLIPVGFIGALVGSFLLVTYTFRRGTLQVDFSTENDATVHWMITAGAATACAAYLLIIIVTIQILLLDGQSHARWRLDHPRSPRLVFLTLALGLFIGAAQMVFFLIPSSFPLFLSQQLMTLLSRGLLTIGCWMAYSPAPPALPVGFVPVLGSTIWRLQSADRGPKEKHRPTPLKLKIGAPVTSTFRRLSTEATRDFYDIVSARPNGTSSLPRPAERVVFRTPAKRAPALSFTSSIFSNQMPQLASALQPSIDVIERETPGRANVKKNYGSIYRPTRVSVDQSELSQWPPRPTSERVRNFSRPSYSQPKGVQFVQPQPPATSTPSYLAPPRPPRSLARLARPLAGVRDSAIQTPTPSPPGTNSTPTDNSFGLAFRLTPRRTPTLTQIQTISQRSDSGRRKAVPQATFAPGHALNQSFEAEVFPVSVGSAVSLDLSQFPMPQTPPQLATRGARPGPGTNDPVVTSPTTAYSTSSSSIKTASTEACVDRTSLFFAPPHDSPTKMTDDGPASPDSGSSFTARPRPARKSSEIMLEPMPADRSSGALTAPNSAVPGSRRSIPSSDHRKSFEARTSQRLTQESEWMAPNRQAVLDSLLRLQRDAGISAEVSRLRDSYSELQSMRQSYQSREEWDRRSEVVYKRDGRIQGYI